LPVIKPAQNLLIRFSEKWAPADGTVNLHLAELDKKGLVWIAKFGKGIGKRSTVAANTEISKGGRVFLILMTTEEREPADLRPRGALFLLDEVRDSYDFSRNLKGIPSYYRKIPLNASTWFKTRSGVALTDDQLNEIAVISSRSPAVYTLRRSMASFFKVAISNELAELIIST